MTVAIDEKTAATLSGITTATLTTVLLKKGLRNVWLRGTKPLRSGQKRLVGPAFTLRFVPAREDLATPESWSSPISTRAAIEAMPAGCIAVVDAMGITDAGIFGDILCARMKIRGVAALVTDGVVEARGKGGELFGFDRTKAISRQDAEEIARTAQVFGQDDDITVLTLCRAAVPASA